MLICEGSRGAYVGCFSRGGLTRKATSESLVIYMGSQAELPASRLRPASRLIRAEASGYLAEAGFVEFPPRAE